MKPAQLSRLLRLLALVALVTFIGIFPVVIAPNDTVNTIAVFTLIGAIAVVGWNIFSGYSGYISLGHSVFYGFGAYTLGLASLDWHISGGWEPFLLLPLAGLVAGAFALPLGWIALPRSDVPLSSLASRGFLSSSCWPITCEGSLAAQTGCLCL